MKEIITCAECSSPVHVQCIDEKYIVCFSCLEKVGDSGKLKKADLAVIERLRRKKKSMGL